MVTTVFYFFINSLAILILIRILHGAASGVTSTATGTIVADIIPHERRGEGIGYYALSTTIAAAIGPFLGMYVTAHTSFYVNFVLCLGVLMVSFFAAFLLKVPTVVLFAAGLFLLGMANQGSVLLLAGVLVGFGYGNFLSNAQAIAIKVSPNHRMGLATTTFFIFADGGVGIGPFLLVLNPGHWISRVVYDNGCCHFGMSVSVLLFPCAKKACH